MPSARAVERRGALTLWDQEPPRPSRFSQFERTQYVAAIRLRDNETPRCNDIGHGACPPSNGIAASPAGCGRRRHGPLAHDLGRPRCEDRTRPDWTF
jgi:hypothetical protein